MLGIAEDMQSVPADDKTRALLDFAYKVSRTPTEIDRSDWDALLAAGWTEQQGIEAVHLVGLFEYLNRVAGALGLVARRPDSPALLENVHSRAGLKGPS